MAHSPRRTSQTFIEIIFLIFRTNNFVLAVQRSIDSKHLRFRPHASKIEFFKKLHPVET